MRRAFLTLVVLIVGGILLGASSAARSLDYYLSNDLGLHGLFHLCEYSNGKVYSFNATQLCPLQVSDEGPPTAGSTTGYKVGEYQDGLTKVCVYNVLGNTKAIRISAVGLCPLTHDF